MTTFHGADTDALRAQALALHDAAQVLDACARRTGAALDALAWHGVDAERTRAEWPSQHARTLLGCAVDMQDAARRLLDEADRQDDASSAGTVWETVRASLDRAHDASKDALDDLGTVATATDLGLLSLAARRWENVGRAVTAAPLDQGLTAMQGAHIGPVLGGAMQGAAALGVASDAYGAYRAHETGDLHGTVDGTVGAVIGAGAFVPGGAIPSLALGIAWDAGTAVGELGNEVMQGTDFHDRFTERMDTAFDVGGAWGMLNTPGALIVTGAEEVALRAGEVWDGLTGTDDGTVDGRR